VPKKKWVLPLSLPHPQPKGRFVYKDKSIYQKKGVYPTIKKGQDVNIWTPQEVLF